MWPPATAHKTEWAYRPPGPGSYLDGQRDKNWTILYPSQIPFQGRCIQGWSWYPGQLSVEKRNLLTSYRGFQIIHVARVLWVLMGFLLQPKFNATSPYNALLSPGSHVSYLPWIKHCSPSPQSTFSTSCAPFCCCLAPNSARESQLPSTSLGMDQTASSTEVFRR